MTRGKLYGIGVGPGAPDLVTVRAVNQIKETEVIYAPFSKMTGKSVALSIIEPYIEPNSEIKTRTFAMNYDKAEKGEIWNDVVEEMVSDVRSGKTVAFISLGDSMLYSTWVSLLERLPKDIPVEITPGITSFSAIASLTHYPLAMEEESLKILACSAPIAEIENAISGKENLVLMKASIQFPEVYALLEKYHLLDQAILVSNASQSREKAVMQLSELSPSEKLSYFSTILINRSWKKSK